MIRCSGRSITRDKAFKELHEKGLAFSSLRQASPPGQLFFGHGLLLIEINLRHIDLHCVVKAVKLEELSDQLSAHNTRSALHDLLGIRVLPVECRLALLDLLLVVDDLEYTGAQLCSELAKYAVSFKSLYN